MPILNYTPHTGFHAISNMLCSNRYILFSELFAALDRQIFAMMERTLDKLWRCIECGKTATGKSDVTRHIEAIHLQGHPGFVCQLCGEAVKTRNAMRQHRKLKHSQIMY